MYVCNNVNIFVLFFMSRSYNWCFTINAENQFGLIEEWKLSAKFKFICYGEEIAPTTGHKHLQGFCGLKNAKTVSSMVKAYPGPHWESMRGRIEQNEKYCAKEGNYHKWGDVPQFNVQNGLDEKERWEDIWTKAKAGQIESIEPMIRLKHYNTISRISSHYNPRPRRLHPDEFKAYWIYGPTRTGKSKCVWDKYEDHPDGFYIKSANNKWWDRYNGEGVVYLEDFPGDGKYLSYYIKTWVDVYPFHAEFKGGSRYARPHTIIVTSNFSLSAVFESTGEDYAAIKARFTEIEKVDRNQNILFV